METILSALCANLKPTFSELTLESGKATPYEIARRVRLAWCALAAQPLVLWLALQQQLATKRPCHKTNLMSLQPWLCCPSCKLGLSCSLSYAPYISA